MSVKGGAHMCFVKVNSTCDCHLAVLVPHTVVLVCARVGFCQDCLKIGRDLSICFTLHLGACIADRNFGGQTD